MKKGYIVDLIFGSVNGGRSSTDSSVTKAQIRALIPAAVNYVMTKDYWANMQREGDKELPGSFITRLENLPVIKDDRNRDCINFDYPVVALAGTGGIRALMDSIGNVYDPRPQGTSPSHWDKVLVDLKEYSQIKGKLLIHNKPELVEFMDADVILDATALSDDDELPIPAGYEPEVIDMLQGFFTNQRMQPKDYIINAVDPLNALNNG